MTESEWSGTESRTGEDAIWQLASGLSAAATPMQIAEVLAEHGAPAAGAAFSNMALLQADGGTVRAVHGSALDEGMAARWAEFELDSSTPLGDAMLSGAAVLLGTLDEVAARYPHLLQDTVAASLSATASLSLSRADGTTLGAVGFGWAEPQHFDVDQLRRIELIAQMTAQALDRAILHRDEQQRHERLQVLQQLTQRLAAATDGSSIAAAVVSDGPALLGAVSATIARLEDGWVQRLDNPPSAGFGGQERSRIESGLPICQAIRLAEAVVLPSHEDRQAADLEPGFVDATSGFGPLVAVPAVVNGRAVGALALAFPPGRRLSNDDLDFLRTVAGQCGQALERERLLDVERARAEDEHRVAATLERNLRRVQALQAVTARLATATTTAAVAQVVVEEGIALVADRGVVALLAADGQTLRTWASTSFPADISDRFRVMPIDSDTPITMAIRTRGPVVADSHEEIAAQYPAVADTYLRTGTQSTLTVPVAAGADPVGAVSIGFDRAGAIDGEVVAFTTTLADLAGQALHRATLHERNLHVAATLQRSLLPHLPIVDGLEVAARYKPGGGTVDVGGDWYEVIDLGAGRTAIVIGDVMGRGVTAAAAMGQLRAAVRSYAQLDLPPAEVLALLDRLVDQLGETNFVTCLYGTYDPADRTLTIANAGHFPPLIARQVGRAAYYLPVPPAPPLGSGAPDYEDHVIIVPPGAVLALFTDGLVEARGHDIDSGTAALAAQLGAHADRPLPDLADRILEAMAAHHRPDDDTALLLLRFPEPDGAAHATKTFAVEAAPTGVGAARQAIVETLRTWSLPEEVIDDIRLVASELLTNAVLYGTAPIEARLRSSGPSLYLEVTDGSPYQPRRRPSGALDEHGRGLLIVMARSRRWGTRPARGGKTVWAEIPLSGPPS